MTKHPRDNHTLIVLGTGTEVGKTFVSAHIAHHLNTTVKILKPVITGFTMTDNDAKILMESIGMPYNENTLAEVCKWRFLLPAAPSWATRVENRPELNLEELLDFCRPADVGCTIIETAGGLMSPLAPKKTNLELVQALQQKTQGKFTSILVSDIYLGSISHTLTALMAAANYNIRIDLIVLNQSQAAASSRIEETSVMLSEHTSIPIFLLPHLSSWQQKSELTVFIDKIMHQNII